MENMVKENVVLIVKSFFLVLRNIGVFELKMWMLLKGKFLYLFYV